MTRNSREMTRWTLPSTMAERLPNAMLEMAPAEYGPLPVTVCKGSLSQQATKQRLTFRRLFASRLRWSGCARQSH